jgi:amino acid transporter
MVVPGTTGAGKIKAPLSLGKPRNSLVNDHSARTDDRAPDAWGERLPRQLGLWSAIAILVGTTIGSGIFRVPAGVASRLGDPGPVLLGWVIGGILTLFGALTLAELAAAFPRSGGIFAYILEGFGPMPAFVYGWTELAVVRAAALGAITTIFAEYLGYFIPLSPRGVQYAAAGVILALGLLNWLSAKAASRLMNVLTLAKYGAMAALVLFAFTVGQGDWGHFTPAFPHGVAVTSLTGALISILWAYDGWSNLSFISGEVRNPTRNLPLALGLGTAAIMVIYLLMNVAYMYLVPLPEMAEAKLVASLAAERIPLLGGASAAVVAALVMTSCFGSANGSLLTGSRVLYAMADRGLLFRPLATVDPRFDTPSTAIWLSTLLGVVYVLFNDFQQLADKFVLGIWPFYALAVAAVFVLRKQRPQMERPYRAWGYPVVPVLFLLAAVLMVVNALIEDPADTGLTFAVILAGVPIYYGWRALDRRRADPAS